MTDFQTAKDALEKLFSAKADEQILSRALTGDGITTSTDVTNRPGYTWVRYNLSPNKVSQVVNTRYPSIATDLPVVIGKMYKDDKFEQILGVDFSQYLDTLTNTVVNNFVVGAHGASHNAVTGSDPAIIDLRNIVEGKGRETVPASLSIYVEAFRYFYNGALVTWGGGQIDISADAPAAGNHLFDLIYVDVATNALDSLPGGEVPIPMMPAIPVVPAGAIPICLVDYINGATSFTEVNIYDYRVWLAYLPNHALLSSMHTDTVASAVTRGDLIVGNATPAWDDLAIGTAHQLLKVNAGGTDPAYASFDWDDVGAAAGADMVHTHASAGEGGQLDWDNVWSDAVHTHASAAEGGQLDWDDVWSDSAHDHSAAGEGGNLIDLNGGADALVLDANGDTSISAPTDDQIDIEINNADAGTWTVAGLKLAVDDDIFPNADGRGLAARFINQTGLTTWGAHFRTGETTGPGNGTLAAYAFAGAPFDTTPSLESYANGNDYMQLNQDGANEHFLYDSIATYLNKNFYARLGCGHDVALGIRFDRAADPANDYVETYFESYTAGVLRWRLHTESGTDALAEATADGPTTMIGGFFTLRFLCLGTGGANWRPVAYIVGEHGDSSAVLSRIATFTFAIDRIGIVVKAGTTGSGGPTRTDWLYHDFS